MTNLQLYLAIGLPCFTICTSLIISLVQLSGLREDMRELRNDTKTLASDLNAKMDMLLAKFYEPTQRSNALKAKPD